MTDNTERTVSIQDSGYLLDQMAHLCSVIWSALAHPSAFFFPNLSRFSDRVAAGRAVKAGLDSSIKAVSIPASLSEPLDQVFGLATGEPLSVLLRAGSLEEPWTSDEGDGVSVAVFTSAAPLIQTNLITGEIIEIPQHGRDQFTNIGWLPEHLLDIPAGGGLAGQMAAIRGVVNAARRATGIEFVPNKQDELTDEDLHRIRQDLGR
jgi:hypothetical protein